MGALFGGERVAQFSSLMIDELGLSGIVAAIILAGFAGMSEYVILFTSHQKRIWHCPCECFWWHCSGSFSNCALHFISDRFLPKLY
jgi:hypothetical protein